MKILRQLEFDCKVRPNARPGEVARVLRCGPQKRVRRVVSTAAT